MFNVQQLEIVSLPEIKFDSTDRPHLNELADYIDNMKQDLFSDNWSTATKKHIRGSLILYIRTMQKKLAPQGAHYRALDIEKGHLEHVIPQNKIINAYLHDKISAEVVLQMPLCMIDDGDKHILETDWQHGATWEYPFKRYQLAGFNKTIKSVRGDVIDFETYTLEDHFKMIGYNA